MKHPILFALGFLLTIPSHLLNAQNTNDINVIPPSPNASSFQKFIDVPVGHYTGIPSITIPLFDLASHQLQLPITLSYHASGLKVNERASWVGAGWSLNAGGAVSRTTKGLPDELDNGARQGYFQVAHLFLPNGNFNIPAIYSCATPAGIPLTNSDGPYTTVDSVAQGLKDLEPDIFYMSAPAGSLKFSFTQNRTPVKFVASDITILQHPFESLGSGAHTWKFKGEDGVVYTFAKPELTEVTSSGGTSLSLYNPSFSSFTSSWYLSSMSLNGDSIKFFYDNEYITYQDHYSESHRVKVSGSGSQGGPSYTNTNTELNGQRLVRIETSTGYTVYFDATVARQDMSGSHRLEKVRIQKDGVLIKGFQFSYDYFGNNTKLKLKKVNPLSIPSQDTTRGYYFKYLEGGPFPAIDSKSQDHWGYYNAEPNTYSMIPPYKFGYYHVNQTSTANRNPNLTATRVGTLQRITYPTGGYSSFDYELHEYYDDQYQSTVIQKAMAIGGSKNNPQSHSVNFSLAGSRFVTITTDGGTVNFQTFTEIRKWNGSAFVTHSPATTAGNRLLLVAGDYQLYAQNSNGGTTFVQVEYEDEIASNLAAGGLRVKSVEIYDPITTKKVQRNFKYRDDSNLSSGKLFTPIILGGHPSTVVGGSLTGQYLLVCVPGQPGTYLNLSTFTQVPLTVNQGSHIAYSQVDEFISDGTQNLTPSLGMSRYEFINETEDPIWLYPFPAIPAADKSHKNGTPLATRVYEYKNSALQKVSETIMSYNEQLVSGPVVKGMALKKLLDEYCFSCDGQEYDHADYQYQTRWHYLSVRTENLYLSGNLVQSRTTNYLYDLVAPHDHFLSVGEQTTSANGKPMTMEYDRLPGTPQLIQHVRTYISSVLTDKTEYVYEGRLLKKQKVWNPDTDTYLTEIENIFLGNKLIEKKIKPQVSTLSTRFLWGHTGAHPIAQVSNSPNENIFFTSFEEDSGSTFNPTDARSGSRYRNSGTFNFSTNGAFVPSSTTDLLMSYWYWNGSSWIYSETLFNNVINAGSRLDDIRVYPKGSEMTTYTYLPGIGVTSITDPNGNSEYYQYDELGRLVLVLDRNKNVSKDFRYNFYK